MKRTQLHFPHLDHGSTILATNHAQIQKLLYASQPQYLFREQAHQTRLRSRTNAASHMALF